MTPYIIAYIRMTVTAVILTIASIVDIKCRKIPNALTFPAIIIGALFGAIFIPDYCGPTVMFSIICLLIGLLPGLGMGDIKLIMAVGIWCGPINAFFMMGMASILILGHAYLLRPAITKLQILRSVQNPFPVSVQEKTSDNTVPFAPYYAAAAIFLKVGTFLWTRFAI